MFSLCLANSTQGTVTQTTIIAGGAGSTGGAASGGSSPAATGTGAAPAATTNAAVRSRVERLLGAIAALVLGSLAL